MILQPPSPLNISCTSINNKEKYIDVNQYNLHSSIPIWIVNVNMLCLRAVVSKVEMIGQLRFKVSRSWYHRFFYTAIFMRPLPSKEMNTAECLHSMNYMWVITHVDDILTKLTTIRALKIDINQ